MTAGNSGSEFSVKKPHVKPGRGLKQIHKCVLLCDSNRTGINFPINSW
jgi:hypothetical protein